MPTFIKTGYWDKLSKAPKGYLNLDFLAAQSNVIKLTKAEIDSHITNNTLVPGAMYEISGVDVPLYGGTTIFLQAATTNTLALAGHGIFYNPKYLNSQSTFNNGYGIWSNYVFLTFSNVVGQFNAGGVFVGPAETVTANNGATATFVSNGMLIWLSGDWSLATSITGNQTGATADVSGGVSPSYAIGQDVIWGGKHWTNTSGNVGTSVDKYTLSSSDWTVVPFNSTDYNVVADVIHYDYEHDMIIRRKDKWNNDVDGNFQIFDEFASPNGYSYGNPIKDFQWGNGPEDWNTDDYNYVGVQSNYVKDSYFECINFVGSSIYFNTVTQQSYLYNNITDFTSYIQFNTVYNYSVIEENKLSSNAYIQYNTLNDSNVEYNSLSNNSSIQVNTLTSGGINYNTISINSDISYNTLTNNSNINSNTLTNSYVSSNVLAIGSEISNNSLTSNSYINTNELNSGTIVSNILTNNIYIRYNSLTTNSSISSNTLTIDSNIEKNVLSDGSDINNNTLSNNSKIEGNSLSRSTFVSNLLDAGSYISFNHLNNSTFDFSSSGTLSGKGIYYITANASFVSFDISTATIIYGYNYPKQIFILPNGTIKIGYYNNSSVFTVVNVNA